MKKLYKFLLIILIGLTSFSTSCNKKQNFTKIDETYTMLLKSEYTYSLGQKMKKVLIKEYDELYCEKLEVIDLLNNVTDCKYNDALRPSIITVGNYNKYFLIFSKNNQDVIEFKFDNVGKGRTYIYDKIIKTSITFDNNKYNYSCLNQLRDKILYLNDNIEDEHKEITDIVLPY